MELDFSEQIRQLGLSKASSPMGVGQDHGMVPDKHKATSDAESEDVGSKDDQKQMPMSNKSVCKMCGMAWGTCAHVNDLNNKKDKTETVEPSNDGMKNGVIAKKEDKKQKEESDEEEKGESKDEEDKEDKEDSKASKNVKFNMGNPNDSKEQDEVEMNKAKKFKAEKYGDPNGKKEEKMEKSMSEKKDHPDKEDEKDKESEKGNPKAEKEEEDSKDGKDSKDKKKFPFDKSKATVSQKISNMLEKKLVAHNEKHEQTLTFEQLSKVYARGLNVFKTTHKPGVSMHEWATARVNLFLKMLSGLPVSNKYSLLDTDVATASNGVIVESGLESYDYIDFSDLEFQLAKISLIDAGLNQNEMNLNLSLSED
jgi:hypothetical protein